MSAESESVSPALNLEKCSVVLLDVAGTTTSVNFVKETLFPYVLKQTEEFLKAHWEDDAVKEAVKILKESELDLAGATTAVKEFTEQNSENKGLKTIQGLIYKQGYDNGDFKAHVFADVAACFETWAKSRKLAIYSTGSVEAQQLLFSHTTEGDISSHITKYFDQSVGNKTVPESYEKIAKELDVKNEEIVFVTDSSQEAKAAKTAGLLTLLVKREGNEAIPEEISKELPVVFSFKDITFENPAKRKNEDEEVSTEEQPPSKVAKTEVLNEKSADVVSPVEEPKTIENVEDEAMEVDAPVEKKIDGAEETSDNNIPKVPIENEKIDEKSDAKEEKTELIETVNVEIPMETSDTVEEKKVEVEKEKPITTEEKKEENNISNDTEKNKTEEIEEIKPATDDAEEEMKKVETETNVVKEIEKEPEVEDSNIDKSEKIETREGSVELSSKKKAEENETMDISSCSGTEEKSPVVIEKSKIEIKEAESDKNSDITETKETVKNEANENKEEEACEQKEETIVSSIEKKVENLEEKVEKLEEKVEKMEEKVEKLDTNEAKMEESTTEVSEKKDEKVKQSSPESAESVTEKVNPKEEKENSTIEESRPTTPLEKESITEKDSKAEESISKVMEENSTETKDGKPEEESSSKQVEEKSNTEVKDNKTDKKSNDEGKEKVGSTQPCPKEDTPEPSSTEQDSKVEQSKEEKENNSELANGIENGQTEKKPEVVNGDSEEKQNGDVAVDEMEKKVEDIKVKKIDDASESTPPVSVEV